MRGAFVLQLGCDTQPPRRHFVGQIEEVDTGQELRFRSTDELLAFLGKCFERAVHRDRQSDAADEDNASTTGRSKV
jgi:hypothetical protein